MEDLEFAFVGVKLSDMAPDGRRAIQIPPTKRTAMLLRLGDKIVCIDHACYASGEPLFDGDIVRAYGYVILRCPCHSYNFDVFTGKRVRWGFDMLSRPDGQFYASKPELKSSDVKQRMHPVEIRNGDDIYVADSSRRPRTPWIESDPYAHNLLFVLPESESIAPSPTNRITGTARIHSRFYVK